MIVVVTWQAADDLEMCVTALRADDLHAPIIIVDNASNDGTEDLLAKIEATVAGVVVVRNQTNLGFAIANDQAAIIAAGRDLLLVNPDCCVQPGAVAALRAHLAVTPHCAAAAAQLRNPDGTLQDIVLRRTGIGPILAVMSDTGRRIDRRVSGRLRAPRHRRDLLATPPTHPVPVDFPAAACVLLRRTAIGELPFDTRFPLYFNDGDLYERLAFAGWGIDLVPAAHATHHHGATFPLVPTDRMAAERIAGLLRYATARWRARRVIALFAAIGADAMATAVFAAVGHDRSERLLHLRAVLGAIGAPGGTPPWLSEPLRRADLSARDGRRVR